VAFMAFTCSLDVVAEVCHSNIHLYGDEWSESIEGSVFPSVMLMGCGHTGRPIETILVSLEYYCF